MRKGKNRVMRQSPSRLKDLELITKDKLFKLPVKICKEVVDNYTEFVCCSGAEYFITEQ